MDTLYVNYVKIANLTSNGKEEKADYALHIFHDWNEIMVAHSKSFEELQREVNISNLKEYIQNVGKSYYDLVLQNDGLYFNSKWYSMMDLEMYSLSNKVLGGTSYVAHR